VGEHDAMVPATRDRNAWPRRGAWGIISATSRGARMFKFEWIIIEVIVLGLLVFELVRTRRAIARDRAARRPPDIAA
jgi:hypothetical protein